MFAWVDAASGGAEVRAATEGAVRVDHAAAIPPQQWAGSVRMRLERLTSAVTYAIGGMERFAAREQRCMASEAKMAAACAHLALAVERAAFKLRIDRLDLSLVPGWFRVFHESWSQHGRAGSCGMRFLQRSI